MGRKAVSLVPRRGARQRGCPADEGTHLPSARPLGIDPEEGITRTANRNVKAPAVGEADTQRIEVTFLGRKTKEGIDMKRAFAFGWASVLGVLALAAGPSMAAPDPDATCQSRRLNALSIYAKKVVFCWAHALKGDPAGDPSACIQTAYDQLAVRWNNADPGTGCNSAAELADMVALIGGNGTDEGAADEILDGAVLGPDGAAGGGDDLLDLADPVARNLADHLLKVAGQKALDLLKAYSQDVHKPKPDKLTRRLDKADRKFIRKWDKAVAVATKKGVVYGGLTSQEAEVVLDDMATDIVEAIQEPPSPSP